MKEKKPGLDNYQREAVYCNESAVVSAGAGAGKTRVLAERFVRLVEEGKARVDQILTLTFTRKAAAEMFERIHRYLSEHSGPLIREQLSSFEDAQISTLDSFCSQIVRNRAEQFGLPPDFSLEEDLLHSLAEKETLSFLLEKRERKAVKSISRSASFQDLWQEIFVPLTERYCTFASSNSFSDMLEGLLENAREEISPLLNTVISLIGSILDLEGAAKTGEKGGDSKSLAKALEGAKKCSRLKEIYSEAGVDGLYELLTSVTMPSPSSSWKAPLLLELSDYLKELKHPYKQLIEITGFLKEETLLKDLYSLWDEMKERFLTIKRRTGILSFQDVMNMAVEVLASDGELRNYYSRKYRYIMIDEFQDNNTQQRDLLFLLSQGETGKLYFLGDEKQSIYRFRGADVSVFKGLSTILSEAGGKTLTLRKNYRSNPDLIQFFNDLFVTILKGEEDYEARFESLESGLSSEKPLPSRISLFVKPQSEPSSSKSKEFVHNDEAEAFFIAKHIKGLVEKEKVSFRDNNEIRRITYGDIALLIRTTGNQIRYEKAFRKLGIPYDTQDIRSLFVEAPINDLYSLLQFALYPEDRQAFASVLRSPFAQLSDTTVCTILLTPPGETLPQWEKEEQKRFDLLMETVEKVRNMVDVKPIGEVLRFLWYDRGYRYTLLRTPSNHAYIEYFDYFLALSEAADRRGEPCAIFLDYLRTQLEKQTRLPELPVLKQNTRGVHILTIHKAKGLEFPVVYVANMGNMGRGSSRERIHCRNDGSLLCSLSGSGKEYITSLVKEDNSGREEAENKRLLYVAITRAQQHLFLSGCFNSKNTSETARDKSLLTILTGGMGWDESSLTLSEEFSSQVEVSTIPDFPKEELLKTRVGKREHSSREITEYLLSAGTEEYTTVPEVISISDLLSAAKELEVFESSAVEDEKNASISVEKKGEEALEKEFGLLCHYILEQMLLGNYHRESIPQNLLTPFTESSWGREALKKTLEKAETMAASFFSSPLEKNIKEARKRETELPFLLLVKPELPLLRGRVDLALFQEKEIHVVDFKTDKRMVPGEHRLQLFLYRTALTEMYTLPVRSSLFYLRYGELVEEMETPELSLESIVKKYMEKKGYVLGNSGGSSPSSGPPVSVMS